MNLEGILSTLETLVTKRVERRAVQRFPTFFGWEQFFDDSVCIGFRIARKTNQLPYLLWITFDDETEGFAEHARLIFTEDETWDREDEKENRTGFDREFESAAQQVLELLHAPDEYGEYLYADEPDFPYGYMKWEYGEVTFALIQANYDPQFGRDISLWALPSAWNLKPPLEL